MRGGAFDRRRILRSGRVLCCGAGSLSLSLSPAAGLGAEPLDREETRDEATKGREAAEGEKRQDTHSGGGRRRRALAWRVRRPFRRARASAHLGSTVGGRRAQEIVTMA